MIHRQDRPLRPAVAFRLVTALPGRFPLADPDAVDRLGADLRAAGYDADGVPRVLGATANRALSRGEPAAAVRATTGGSPVETLIRLFLLGTTEPQAAVARALPTLGVDRAVAAGALEFDGAAVRAGLDIRPHADDDSQYLVVSDLDSDVRPGPVRPDHVLGIGQASISLATAVIRDPVGSALDIGTGCGIQALHCWSHAGAITATDPNPRALALAAATARLNGQRWDLLEGSLFEPVAGRRFDLVVSNPPFVVGDGTLRYSYRDSGMAGDGISAALVRGVAEHLNPDGTAQLLANWLVKDGADWRPRVAGWLAGTGCHAWVVQRERADPAEYAALWAKDAGEDGARAVGTVSAWLDYFEAERVSGIGMGLITMRRTDNPTPDLILDEIPGAGEQVTGPEAAGFLARRRWLTACSDGELLASRLVLDPAVLLQRRDLPGPNGWSTVLRMLIRPGGPGATLQVDEWGERLLAGCTGDVPLSLQVDLLAGAFGLDPNALAGAVLPAIRVGITRGLLHPAD